jgi:hypothetical protein
VYNDEAERHPPAKGGFCKAKVLNKGQKKPKTKGDTHNENT